MIVMWFSDVKQFKQGLAAVLLLSLAACGGGDGGSADTASDGVASADAGSNVVASDRAQAMAMSIVPAVQPETSEAILVTRSADGKSVTTSPALYKAGGIPVTTLEDLPEGISNSDWMKKTGARLPLRVVLSPGTYYLSRPWTWTPAQSGRSDSRIYVMAQTPGTVVISGAKEFAVPKSVHGGAAKATFTLPTSGVVVPDQLWVNGMRAVLARSPNVGSFYYVKDQVKSWYGSPTYDGVPVEMQAFSVDTAPAAILRGLSTTQLPRATLVVTQSWTTSYHKVAELTSANEARVTPAAKWPFLNPVFGQSQRYFIENFGAALDAPGEWYRPAADKLEYMLTTADKQSDLTASIPQQAKLLVVQGDAKNSKWVEYIHFQGLKFRYASSDLPASGYVDNQAASEVEAALMFDSARNVSVSGCEVSKVGGYAIWFRANVRNSEVSDCEIFDTGAGGIKVGQVRQVADTNATAYNLLTLNRIHSTGHRFPGGVGVWIGDSAYNRVEDNLIGDTTYSGISVGWTWGYSASNAHHNTISRNFLYDIGQWSLNDIGGIYTLGVSPGTEIKGNVVKNVRSFSDYGAGAWGLYNDAGSSQIVMDSNMVVGTSSSSYHQSYGSANVLSNNVFAKGDMAELQFGKAEDFNQLLVDANFMLPVSADFVDTPSNALPTVTYSRNLLSNKFSDNRALSPECGTGCTLSSSLGLSDPNKLDVPVISNASGPVTLPSRMTRNWSSVALTQVPSPSLIWGVAPNAVAPRPFEFLASNLSEGVTPAGLIVTPADRPDLISATKVGGDMCVAFKDSGAMKNRWEPFGRVDVTYAQGTSTAVFTLKADAATEFVHEWRDGRYGTYNTGPSILFSAAKGIKIGATVLGALPVGQWITVTVTVQQGTNAKWSVKVAYADGSVVSANDLPPLSPGWTTTYALFFISNAATTSTPCMGRASISNVQ